MTGLISYLKKLFARRSGEEWQCVTVSRSVRLLDGTYAAGTVMRRMVRGKVQYRRATPEEIEADDDDWSSRVV